MKTENMRSDPLKLETISCDFRRIEDPVLEGLGAGPQGQGGLSLSLPLTQWLSCGLLAQDYLCPGERLRAVEITERRERRGDCNSVWRAAVPEGAVLVVTNVNSTAVARALVMRGGEPVELSRFDAEDLLDPAGARRWAWRRRLLGTLLTAAPKRYRMDPGHGVEADVVYDWCGRESVALCVRATERYVWLRAVTYEEAKALGLI